MFKYLAFIGGISGLVFYFFGVTSERFSASYPYPVPIVYNAFGSDFVAKDKLIETGSAADVYIQSENEKNARRTYLVMAEGEEIGRIMLEFRPTADGKRSEVIGSVAKSVVNRSDVTLKDSRTLATALDVRLGGYNRLSMKAAAAGYESIEAMMYGESLGAKMAFGNEGAKEWGNQVAAVNQGQRDGEPVMFGTGGKAGAELTRRLDRIEGERAYSSDLARKAAPQ